MERTCSLVIGYFDTSGYGPTLQAGYNGPELIQAILLLLALPGFDFREDIVGWQAQNDVSRLSGSPDGMVIEIGGADPYIAGPPRDFPERQPLWAELRLKSDQGGVGQIFWFSAGRGPSEEASVRFEAQPGQWSDVRVKIPALGPATRIRIDPPGTGGKCILATLTFQKRKAPTTPRWLPLTEPRYADPQEMRSGSIAVRHDGETFGGFQVLVDGECVAIGNDRPMVGYSLGEETRWVDVATVGKASTWLIANGIAADESFTDPDGAAWKIEQRFTATNPGSIDVVTKVTVSRDREVVHLPLLTLLPGVGGSGPKKGHALFAGLEYLDDEPSSSEADIVGPGSKRQVPNSDLITFPLMAVQANDRYVGMIWDQQPETAPIFDSPDRIFGYGGHVMGLVFPGKADREPGFVVPAEGARLQAAKALVQKQTIIGGRGSSIVPAVRQYVALRGLPPLPITGMDKQSYIRFAAGGWLDSRLREGDRYRHAYWPGAASFAPMPAAGVGAWAEWLAGQTTDGGLGKRLEAAAKGAVAQVQPADYSASDVSHVRFPVASLLFGHVAENAERALVAGREHLKRFEPSGSLLYKASGTDYGRTHFAKDANGNTASAVHAVLESAIFCGDPSLLKEGLRLLRAMDRFADSAPRGAQTWEVPLHTPDILASAELVRAYTIGYELTGERKMLDMAKYWAWTGVPFIYLVNPTQGPVGLYATIPVFGATNWTWSWLGLPVQWCGLVYSDALYRLVRHDPGGPWRRLADGIAASGIQQSFPLGDRDLQGLLPDSFNLRPQTRNGVAINPGTLQANAIRLYGGPEMYDFRSLRVAGLLVHAPGEIQVTRDSKGIATFTVKGWPKRAYSILITGLKEHPVARVNGRAAEAAYGDGRLVLKVTGSAKVEITVP